MYISVLLLWNRKLLWFLTGH